MSIEYCFHRFDLRMTADQSKLEEFLNSLAGEIAAIVTDMGAPPSHAAVVARELGIPTVVGCGNATMLLKTGDYICVDGGRGVAEILKP